MWTFSMNMKTRSGFEYTFASLVVQKRTSTYSRRRAVKWHRFVKRHLEALNVVFGPRTRVDSIVQELTRFMIKSKSASKAHWTQKWATGSLARRFVSTSVESSHTSLERPAQAPLPLETPFNVSFRTVTNSFAWKNPLNFRAALLAAQHLDLEHAVMKRELFGKRGEFTPSWVPIGKEFAVGEWEMVYRTPSDSLDARFALSKPKPCSVPCFCRLHLGSSKIDAECITCENYAFAIKQGGSRQLWSPFFSRFKEHVLECRSMRARRYRRRYGSPYQMDEVCFEDTFFY